MNIPVLLAFLGSGLNTTNDLIYRRIAKHSNASTYTFYILASLFSALAALVINISVFGKVSIERVDISYGILLGFISFIVYILFLLSFSGSNTAVSVTIYRLNMIPGTLLAVLFLGEHVPLKRIFGILLCVLTIFVFVLGEKIEKGQSGRSLLLGLGACIMGGVLNYTNKLAVTNGGEPMSLLLWRFITVFLLAVVLIPRKKCSPVRLKDAGYSMFSGITLLMAIFCILNAMKAADLTAVIPITQLSFVFTSLISAIFLKEKLDKFKTGGIVLAFFAVVLIL